MLWIATGDGVMSCFWGHKWGKWESYKQDMIRTFKSGEVIPFTRNTQERACEECGYKQIETGEPE